MNSKGLMVASSVEKVCSPELVSAPEQTEIFGVGNGFDRYPALGAVSGQLAGIHVDVWPKASSMLHLANEWLIENEPLAAEMAQPVYLRDNVAKKEKDR